jgi:hypothetical protein
LVKRATAAACRAPPVHAARIGEVSWSYVWFAPCFGAFPGSS